MVVLDRQKADGILRQALEDTTDKDHPKSIGRPLQNPSEGSWKRNNSPQVMSHLKNVIKTAHKRHQRSRWTNQPLDTSKTQSTNAVQTTEAPSEHQ